MFEIDLLIKMERGNQTKVLFVDILIQSVKKTISLQYNSLKKSIFSLRYKFLYRSMFSFFILQVIFG